METKIRARRGGQLGDNGSFYDGGQFLPVATTEKGGKRYVAPFLPSAIVKPLAKMDGGEKNALIEELKVKLVDLEIPNLRRPGAEHFSADYILRNVSGINQEALAVLKRLVRCGS